MGNTGASGSAERVGLWGGVCYALMMLLGWWLVSGFLPPQAPSFGAEEVARFYRENFVTIRIGMVIVMFGGVLYAPFAALAAKQIARVEGGVGVLTICQIMAGMAVVLLAFYPAIWCLSIAYRPGRTPEFIQLINDAIWLQLIGGVTPFLLSLLSLAAAALKRDGKVHVFPRRYGYFTLLATALMLPRVLVFFYQSGPFAWDGLLAFWLPSIALLVWILVTTVVLRKAIFEPARS